MQQRPHRFKRSGRHAAAAAGGGRPEAGHPHSVGLPWGGGVRRLRAVPPGAPALRGAALHGHPVADALVPEDPLGQLVHTGSVSEKGKANRIAHRPAVRVIPGAATVSCMYVCMYVCVYVCMCIYMYVCMYVCMFLCVCLCVCMYGIVCVCMYVCMNLYKNLYLSMYVCVCMYGGSD